MRALIIWKKSPSSLKALVLLLKTKKATTLGTSSKYSLWKDGKNLNIHSAVKKSDQTTSSLHGSCLLFTHLLMLVLFKENFILEFLLASGTFFCASCTWK